MFIFEDPPDYFQNQPQNQPHTPLQLFIISNKLYNKNNIYTLYNKKGYRVLGRVGCVYFLFYTTKEHDSKAESGRVDLFEGVPL